MRQKVKYLIFILTLLITNRQTHCQSIDSTSFNIESRFSFYSFEKEGEFLLHIPPEFMFREISVTINYESAILTQWSGRPGKAILRIPFTLPARKSISAIIAEITTSPGKNSTHITKTDLYILDYKTNEVKSDRLTGGLIVNKLPFFPFGFYCYSPVYPTLPEEEVVKGFNMISPYQKVIPETLNERKAYMDRCAQLGMKVNYNLLSVSGGGGVGSKIEGLTDQQKRELLLNEINTFKDHPALLSWYISDEPNGFRMPPEQLEEIYNTIKKADPWHPLSVVFCAPFMAARKYVKAFDIAMADPYPVTSSPITIVGDVTSQLRKEFNGKKSLWIVPQAFGGGEWWDREPTIQEIRTMTWQAIINGATGIQYFVRQGLNYFPKSTATWNECGKMAMEIAELTPWLLSEEVAPQVISYNSNISVTSKLHEGKLVILAVNKTNQPVSLSLSVSGGYNSKARVIFENRSVNVIGGNIYDQISAYGSQTYLIDLKSEKTITTTSVNLLNDSGFEDNSSPGVPTACYARPGGDRGATYFLDTREHYDGSHSLRLITPSENKGVSIRFFPFTVKAGATYSISIWAKSDPEQRISLLPELTGTRQTIKNEMPQYAEIRLGDFGTARFSPENRWRRFVTFITIPTDTTASFRTNLILRMPGQGVAWFDQIRVIEEK